MKQLIYIHGGMCFPDTDSLCKTLESREYNPLEEKVWKDWFKEITGEYQIIRPEMPNKNMASYKAWKIRFEKIFPYLNDEDLILVGHSLGAMFLIKYLGENTLALPGGKKIKQLHLISSVFDESDMSDDEKYAGDFAYEATIIPNIQNQVEQIFLYHSRDDDIVPYSHTEKIKTYLPEAKIITLRDRGHFFGQLEFPELLENIVR